MEVEAKTSVCWRCLFQCVDPYMLSCCPSTLPSDLHRAGHSQMRDTWTQPSPGAWSTQVPLSMWGSSFRLRSFQITRLLQESWRERSSPTNPHWETSFQLIVSSIPSWHSAPESERVRMRTGCSRSVLFCSSSCSLVQRRTTRDQWLISRFQTESVNNTMKYWNCTWSD